MSFLILQGDARHIPLRDESIHCVVTSPPFFGLRDYQTGTWQGGLSDCDHERIAARNGRGGSGAPGKQTPDSFPSSFAAPSCGKCGALRIDKQIGLESTVAAYLAEMVAVFREVKRILRYDGTVWCEIGDSFQDKQQLGIPWRLAFALQEDGWWLRQDLIWHRPNPIPESVSDRCTKSHSYIFLLTKSPRYYYDHIAIQEPSSENSHPRGNGLTPKARQNNGNGIKQNGSFSTAVNDLVPFRNKRSVWEIPTAPSSLNHYASFPPEIPRLCISAGTSEKGCCPYCLSPWKRMVEKVKGENDSYNGSSFTSGKTAAAREPLAAVGSSERTAQVVTVGWQPTCDCPQHEPVPCRVLDPFGGTGTTAVVADRLGRHGISLDLSREYSAMAHKRVFNDAPLFVGLTPTPPVMPAPQAGLFGDNA